MNTGETEAKVTESNETEKRNTITVNVPVTVTVSVPIEIAGEMPDNAVPFEELGCMMIDPNQNPDLACLAVEASQASDAVGRTFDRMVSTALRLKEKYPDIDIYITPFAGLVEEQKL